MKRLLFISPDYYGFHEVIRDGFSSYSGYEVTTVITNQKYNYKNIGEKIINFFSKLFLKKNLKKINQENLINKNILINDSYDVVFINRPDMISEKTYSLLTKICKKKITYFWDSFDKIKGQKETIKYFDKCYSFDVNDCEKYGLIKAHNFYFCELINEEPTLDVLFLGTFDKRFSKVKEIITNLNNQNINAEGIILSFDNKIISEYSSEKIKFINEIIPFKDSSIHSRNAKIILDIHHDNQIGLSFRPYEALGLNKKLITTNEHIKDYDFYSPDNIFIWKDDTKELPIDFITKPYKEIPFEIKEKYSLKKWVVSILN